MLKVITEEDQEKELESLDENYDYGLLPRPPDTLNFPGKLIWWKLGRELMEKGKLTESVQDILETYCIVKGHAVECQMMIKEHGKIIGGKIHPLWKPMIEAINQSKAIYLEIFLKKDQKVIQEEEKDETWGDKSLLA